MPMTTPAPRNTQEMRPTRPRQAARRRRERQNQRWVLAFAGIVIFLVLAIPAYGYYNTFVGPPHRTVFEVNGVKHTLGEVAKFSTAQAAIFGSQLNLGSLPIQVLTNMMNDELISQRAPGLGIVVTQDEVDAGIRSLHYPTPTEGQQTDPAALEREFKQNLRTYLDITKFSSSEYREIVRRGLLRDKLLTMLSAQIPRVQEQVYVHWISLSDESTVSEVQTQLKAGKAFDSLARIYMSNDSYADDNGEVGWVPKGAFPLLDDALFSLAKDTVSEPISDPPNTYFIKVTDGPTLTDVSPKMLDVLETQALQKWLDDQLKQNEVIVSFGSTEYAWVFDKIRELIPAPTPTPTP